LASAGEIPAAACAQSGAKRTLSQFHPPWRDAYRRRYTAQARDPLRKTRCRDADRLVVIPLGNEHIPEKAYVTPYATRRIHISNEMAGYACVLLQRNSPHALES
jgi:hypothetical protein